LWRQQRWQLRAGALTVIVVAAVLLVAITTTRSPTSARDRRWRTDIAYLATELPRVHVDGLVDVSHSEWDAAAGRLEAQVPRLGRGQLIVGLTHRPPMVAVPVPLYERHNAWPYWMVTLRARHAVYLKYNQCLDNDGFQRLAARALTALRRHPGYRLIVDLRRNGGGDTTPFQELVSRIRADPAINVRGRIFGLIDSSTDSSAGLDASDLGQETRAILMGQQIEDPIDEFGNDNLSFTLPYSHLTIQYTTKIVNPAKKHHGAPDIVVAPTLQQVMNGTDPVLQRALS
jgi:hypothetical protein